MSGVATTLIAGYLRGNSEFDKPALIFFVFNLRNLRNLRPNIQPLNSKPCAKYSVSLLAE